MNKKMLAIILGIIFLSALISYAGEKDNFDEVGNPSFAVSQCQICGYCYDPQEGDPDQGVPPGTLFEDLPDDWVCPRCGCSDDEFHIIHEQKTKIEEKHSSEENNPDETGLSQKE